MKTITIRNVPEELQRLLKERAEKSGLSLSEYLLGELTKIKTHHELMERIRSRTPVRPSISAADVIREGREERERQMDEWLSSLTPRR